MVRFSPLVAWFLTLFAVITVSLMNLSGFLNTSVNYDLTSSAVDGIFLGREQILFIEINPNAENYSSALARSFSWTCAVYLNAVCSSDLSKSPSEVGYWTCAIRAGQSFDLYQLLSSAESVLASTTSPYAAGSSTLPSRNMNRIVRDAAVPLASPAISSDLAVEPISLVGPFVFYMIGLAGALVLLFTVPGTWCGLKRRNLMNFNIAWVSFLAFLLAASLITGMARSTISHLQSPPASRYVIASYTSPIFIGLEWSTVGAMFVAATLLAAEWNMERFTPLMSTIDRRWKPNDVSWLGRKKPDLSVVEDEAQPESEKATMGFVDDVRLDMQSVSASDSERTRWEGPGPGWI